MPVLHSEKNCVRFFTDFSADAWSEIWNLAGRPLFSFACFYWTKIQHICKRKVTLVVTFIDFKNFTSWTSVFHYLDPSLPLLKRGHEKLWARVLVNLFSMPWSARKISFQPTNLVPLCAYPSQITEGKELQINVHSRLRKETFGPWMVFRESLGLMSHIWDKMSLSDLLTLG